MFEGYEGGHQGGECVSQVALRLGNYKLIELLLRFGANVNYYCRVNTTHFPSALQYALKDEVCRGQKVAKHENNDYSCF